MDEKIRSEMQSALERILRAAREDLKVRTTDGGAAAPEVTEKFRSMIQGLEALVRGEHDSLSCRAFRELLFSESADD